MSDQVAEQSPQSRLEAMLGDSIQEEVKQQPTEEQPLEAEAEAEVPAEEAVAEEEVVDDAPDDLTGHLGVGQGTAKGVDAASLGTALDAVVLAPPASLGITEQGGLDAHARTVGPLFAAEALEGAMGLRNGVNLGTAFHGGSLLGGLGLLDSLGRGTTLQHGAKLKLLRLHPLQELNPLAELVGLRLKAAERRLLLFAHGLGRSLTLGGTFGQRLHLGDNGSQFVEQCLDLVHEVSLLCSGRGDQSPSTTKLRSEPPTHAVMPGR